MENPADRHQWAIERGQEHKANVHQQAVLVYVAFRVGKENKSWWSLDKIAEQTRMHKNTVSKCLRWWTRLGVLKGTPQLRDSTIYQIEEHSPGAIEPNIPPQVILEDADSLYHSLSDIEPESNITPEVLQYPSPSDPISLPECSNIPSEYPLKEHKENGNEREKENSIQHTIREYLLTLPEAKRPSEIKIARARWPELQGDVLYFRANWDKFVYEVCKNMDYDRRLESEAA